MGSKQSKNLKQPPPKISKLIWPPPQIRPPTRMQTGLDGFDFQIEYQDKTQISKNQSDIKSMKQYKSIRTTISQINYL